MPGLSVELQKDEVTPDLQKLIRALKNPQPLLRAVGVSLVGLTKEAFNNPSLRPAPWPNKKDGSKATLKSRQASLWRSIAIKSVNKTDVVFGSDKPYAAIHQLGGRSRPMPERPYMPFRDAKLTEEGEKRLRAVVNAYIAKRGKSG